MKNAALGESDGVARGKTIHQLIRELQSFENQELEVRLSVDNDTSNWPVSLVGHSDGKCVLMYSGERTDP